MDVTCTCGVTFQAKSPRAKFCSDRCRKRRQRGGDVVPIAASAPVDDDSSPGAVERVTIRELEDAGRLDTTLGQTCRALARRLDAPGVDTGSAMAAVARELKATLAEATRGTAKATSPQQLRDELAERRQRHGA